jgi:hypothetical protein
MIFLAGDPPLHEAMAGQGYLALVSSVLATLVCKHPRPPTPHPQERHSYDKAKYEEVQKKGVGCHRITQIPRA